MWEIMLPGIWDLSNYYNYFKIDNRGILTVDFYEQNGVNDFTGEYDGMIGVIKWIFHF